MATPNGLAPREYVVLLDSEIERVFIDSSTLIPVLRRLFSSKRSPFDNSTSNILRTELERRNIRAFKESHFTRASLEWCQVQLKCDSSGIPAAFKLQSAVPHSDVPTAQMHSNIDSTQVSFERFSNTNLTNFEYNSSIG